MNLRNCLQILALIIFSNCAFAQSISVADKSLVWHSEISTEFHSDLVFYSACSITTNARNFVLLNIQGQKTRFAIQSVSGTWMNENEDGSLIYTVEYVGYRSGKIMVERINGLAKVTFDFRAANPTNGMHQEFVVTSVDTN